MRGFFKSFFASLLALIVFVPVIAIIGFLFVGFLASYVTSSSKPTVSSKAVLVLDLNQLYNEKSRQNPFAGLGTADKYDYPGLFDMVRMIRYAKSDSSIKGIYVKCDGNANGFATSQEIRNALVDFKSSKKFIYAFGDVIAEKAYYVANVADKIYCNPVGGLEWKGYALSYLFLKQTLARLDIQPQIFYAGKFKSATEPLREEKMTEPNKVQSRELISYLYNQLLLTTSETRGIDTATLHGYANNYLVRTGEDAVKYKLVDGVKYNDEVQEEIKNRLGIKSSEAINFISFGKYAEAVNYKPGESANRIAVIYAEGDIVDGKGDQGQIGSETFRELVRKARLDDQVKAVVFRVNSGGGSALASENIWRELLITKKSKPVVLSFGDVAASGGYYLASCADSIFAQPTTITGSIGVFTIIPNMEGFFKNKLGVTFDGVKTADHADAMTVVKPLSEIEKSFVQADVNKIYEIFKSRVADGRGMTVAEVDSIGQGRVWMGEKALGIGLVDKLGNLQDAIDCASRMAKVNNYRLKEFPEPLNIFELLLGDYQKAAKVKALKEEMGEEAFSVYSSVKKTKSWIGVAQARMPFEISIK